ncbi:MAG: DUF1786 domain-containing protein [Chloroflexi bacterium]|nr:DUF1786 domain-containing protein [Chloroflexota bacterium]
MEQATRILAIDVGAGTQDVLLYESDKSIENCVKLVVPSQTVVVARRIARATAEGRAVFLTGNLMGGGACGSAVKRHVRAGLKVYATALAGKTLHDNLEYVQAMGVEIVEQAPPGAVAVQMRDIDLDALRVALAAFETELPERLAIAVQDHGESLWKSNREFRFEHFRPFVQGGGEFRKMAYKGVPSYLTRMQAVQHDCPGAVLMDTGPAAIWGSLYDDRVAERTPEGVIVVNIGNAHTFGALVQNQRIWGLFEHHTGDVTTLKLKDYIARLRENRLPHEEVLGDGGHGCYVHPDFSAGSGFSLVSVTGPNRAMAEGLGCHFAAPYGDMMLTGCFGLVAAARELDRSPLAASTPRTSLP